MPVLLALGSLMEAAVVAGALQISEFAHLCLSSPHLAARVIWKLYLASSAMLCFIAFIGICANMCF